MLLAVDTSTAQVGLALYDGDHVPGEMIWTTSQHHTTELAPALAGLLARSGVSMDGVSALGVAIGPGSFTSLRVGLAFVKGLALARSLPIIGLPTLDIIAAAQPVSENPLAVVIQAGRGRIALAWYESSSKVWQALGPARSSTVDELIEEVKGPTLVAGELTSEERKKLDHKHVMLASPVHCVRRPSILAEMAWAKLQENKTDQAASLAPIYLHVAGAPLA
jgi:tRNA threonylcarbamoyladenosine biosynthesis protein TsaB